MPAHWTIQEKKLLLEAVNNNKINNRIQWNEVQSIVKTKTYNQCRTMYSVILKPTEQLPVNFKWTFKNYAKLLVCVLEYGTKWEFIQKNYFQNTTSNALKKKYIKSNKILERIIDVIKQLNRQVDVQLTEQEVKQLQVVIQFICYRAKLCSWYYQAITDPNVQKPIFPINLESYRDDELETEAIDILESKLYRRISRYIDFETMQTQIMNMSILQQ
ncbi:Myb-like_DNA-binding domain-containing protein [Hexamita inflata]|uniref:Myb-like_DNA-binding domain-containing protein n=1 Tax=Hexamita inflata TaxID=28002 RepID=A0ABP1HGG5_9EUKA